MDNPAYFTVLQTIDGVRCLVSETLYGSGAAAGDAAAKLRIDSAPDTILDVAVATMLEQDPVTGTPLGHLLPPAPAGYALAAMAIADPGRRRIHGALHADLTAARAAATTARATQHLEEEPDVFDVVALTVIAPGQVTGV